MAYIGLPYYGYCPITVATNADGSETESLGNGKITRAMAAKTTATAASCGPVTAASSAMQVRPARS